MNEDFGVPGHEDRHIWGLGNGFSAEQGAVKRGHFRHVGGEVGKFD
jgi:hypothetical protein